MERSEKCRLSPFSHKLIDPSGTCTVVDGNYEEDGGDPCPDNPPTSVTVTGGTPDPVAPIVVILPGEITPSSPPQQTPQPPPPNTGKQPDNKSCSARLAQGVQKNLNTSISNLQYTGTVGGHANYTFDVGDPLGFQGLLNQNPPWPLPFGLDQGSRYGVIQSNHIENTATGGFSGHTDLFNGHSLLAPLHLIVDVAIGQIISHIPGANLDLGCKANP